MKTFTLIVFVLSMILNAENTLAQKPDRPIRERIINAKFDEICRRMELESSKADQLRPVFRSFEKEKTALLLNNYEERIAFPDSTLSEQQQDELYLKSLQKAKKLVELREVYYPKFRTVLTPRQIVQFNRIEMELNKRMMQQLKKRMNDRNPAKI